MIIGKRSTAQRRSGDEGSRGTNANKKGGLSCNRHAPPLSTIFGIHTTTATVSRRRDHNRQRNANTHMLTLTHTSLPAHVPAPQQYIKEEKKRGGLGSARKYKTKKKHRCAFQSMQSLADPFPSPSKRGESERDAFVDTCAGVRLCESPSRGKWKAVKTHKQKHERHRRSCAPRSSTHGSGSDDASPSPPLHMTE
jgi:hypothetical protein